MNSLTKKRPAAQVAMAAKAAAARQANPTPVAYPPYRKRGPKSAAGPKRRRPRRYDDGDDDADSDADTTPAIQRGPQAVKAANKARHAKLPTVLSLEDVDADATGIRLLSKLEVMDRVGVSFPTLWKWMRAQPPTFPRARALGGTTVWIASEVEAWMASLPLRPLKGDEEAA